MTMAESMAEIITNVTSFVTAAVQWMTSFVTTIVDQPVLFIFVVAVPLVGLGVGLLNRLFRTN